MDWWKLFSGTFILIFLAELGDKTQLAALAKTADSPDSSMAKWVVFLGASLALVASTFVAVFLGHILKSLVPDERYIKIAAGALFLVFGFMILRDALFKSPKAEPAVAAAHPAVRPEPGLVGGIALGAAMDFESLTMDRYRRLAAGASGDLARLLSELSKEEEAHLNRLRGLPEQDKRDTVWDVSRREAGISGRSVNITGDDRNLIAQLVAHEETTAHFYRDLADRTLIPSVRIVLQNLADDESAHARRLREFGEA